MTFYDYASVAVIASVWLAGSAISIHFVIDLYKDYRDGSYSITLFELLMVGIIATLIIVTVTYGSTSYIIQLSQTHDWW